MNRRAIYLMAACIPALMAAPAAAKSADKKPEAKSSEKGGVPPGILIALEKAFPKVGHGPDQPKGNGKGWGHLLHDHEDPVSP